MIGSGSQQRWPHLDLEAFSELVHEAWSAIPEPFRTELKRVMLIVEEEPAEQQLLDADLDPEEGDLLGFYDGVPVTERAEAMDDHPEALRPPRIFVYCGPLVDAVESHAELVLEVQRTVIHEVAHHFGLEEDEVERLGYA